MYKDMLNNFKQKQPIDKVSDIIDKLRPDEKQTLIVELIKTKTTIQAIFASLWTECTDDFEKSVEDFYYGIQTARMNEQLLQKQLTKHSGTPDLQGTNQKFKF